VRRVSSGTDGEFLVAGLPPGRYEVVIFASGFALSSTTLTTAVSTAGEFRVTLHPAASQESIRVKSQGSSITEQQIDVASSVHQSVITDQDLKTFPLAARSFANIAYLAPGTEPVEPSDPTKARITAVSTGGSSGLNNEISVDGGDNSDDYIGGVLQNLSPDAILEFAVRSAQQYADTGNTTAGSFVLATKGGTNQWHGEGAFFGRMAALNARLPIENPSPNPKQRFSRQNYVATLGGPIHKDRLWLFASFEHVHEDASIVYSPESVTQFDALSTLAAYGLIPGVASIGVPANVPIPFRDTLGTLRLDWAPTTQASWFLRSSVDTYITHNAMVQQGTLPSTGLSTHSDYLSLVLGNQIQFSSTLAGNFIFNASGLHLRETRSSDLGFALAFPFSSTSLTVSGFETFGDNQFATPITYFPSNRGQQKYQIRYDLIKSHTNHTIQFGANLIHEPVLDGAFPANTETLYTFPENPLYYLSNLSQFRSDMQAGAATSNLGGPFSQNVQRFALYGQDSWRLIRQLTFNYGLRYSTTQGLFVASGRNQASNPGYITLAALNIPLVSRVPKDDSRQIAPRLGIVYAPRSRGTTLLRGGFGLYFSDLAQNGWATAFQAVNDRPLPCIDPLQSPGGGENAGCIGGAAAGARANLIDPGYRTPYAIHVSAGIQQSFGRNWAMSGDYIHQQGNHAYRGYSYSGGKNLFTPRLPENDPGQAAYVPDVNVAHSDNRSSYNALLVHLQGNAGDQIHLVANYTLAKAQTWGCVLGELFDYVNGVCNPRDAFAFGDYGPSGEDVRHRFVFAADWRARGGFELSTLAQAETPRPFTITTVHDSGRIAINGVPTTLDQFRGTAYVQADLRVSRPIPSGDRWTIAPFVECFNLFNRNNPGANFVANVASLPVPSAEAQIGDVSDICSSADCSTTEPIRSLKQLRVPAGALGDFFGPGTTVGISFTAQVGIRVTF
jgi:hypothetical protein